MSIDASLAQRDFLMAKQEAKIIQALLSLGSVAVGPSVVPDSDASCAPVKFAFSGNPGRDNSPVWSFSIGSLVAGNGVHEKPLGDTSAAGMKQATSEPFVFGAPAIEAPSFDFV